jgi:uncharacterized linocin/CFP29 family protein
VSDLLRRSLAPVTDSAWAAIDEEARDVLALQLGARRLVDFDGPHGWSLAAVNLGTWSAVAEKVEDEVHLGTRDVAPLVEVRIPITLSIAELDTIERGALAPNLDGVVAASETLARLENAAVLAGNESLGMCGVAASSPHEPLRRPDDASSWLETIVDAMETLRQAGVSGPYGLALGPDAYTESARATHDGYPLREHLSQLVRGPLVWVPGLDGAIVMSLRGGDFVLTVGQDASIGYASHTRDQVELFLTQSFAFRVLEPAAAVELR